MFRSSNNSARIRLVAWIRKSLQHGDRPWNALVIIAAIAVPVLMLAIGWLLWSGSATARSEFGWRFLIPTLSASWNPVTDKFQSWPFIYGTLLTSLTSLIVAIPVSLGIAIFLAEISPNWLRQPLGWTIELLAAIPSVVYGLWGIFAFLPILVTPTGNFLNAVFAHLPLIGGLFQGPMPPSGSSRLAAGLILSVMITPTIAAVTRDVFLAIPRSQREAAFALGSTQWEMIWQVLIPYGLSGILGAVILGLGRALGETIAVTMVIGNNLDLTASLLHPGYTMASIIANEFTEAVGDLYLGSLIELGLVLFAVTFVINGLARLLILTTGKQTAHP